MKTTIIILVAIIGLLFWSPWLGEDGGENVIRKLQTQPEVQAELDELAKQYAYNVETGEGCDGLTSKWAPFGRTVEYCEYGSWYVTFWGQRF